MDEGGVEVEEGDVFDDAGWDNGVIRECWMMEVDGSDVRSRLTLMWTRMRYGDQDQNP